MASDRASIALCRVPTRARRSHDAPVRRSQLPSFGQTHGRRRAHPSSSIPANQGTRGSRGLFRSTLFTYPLVFFWSVRKGLRSPLDCRKGFTGSGSGSPCTRVLREIDYSDPAGGSRHPVGRPTSAALAVL